VRDFEKGRRVPISNNLEAMRRALEGEGVRFFEDATEAGIAITRRVEAEAGQPPRDAAPRRPERGERRKVSPSGRHRQPKDD
jgi:hypothetical protein